jgi:hypothetical protein
MRSILRCTTATPKPPFKNIEIAKDRALTPSKIKFSIFESDLKFKAKHPASNINVITVQTGEEKRS